DRLTGSPEVNVLGGGNGDNFITGLGAPSGSGDLLSGGTDTSTLNCDDGRDHAAGVTVNLQAQVGCYPDDQVFGFTVVLGTDGPDDLGGTLGGQRLEGRGGDDILRGGSGDDVLVGGPGGDTLSGGLDSDTASYDDGRAAGVVVDLAAIPLGGDAGETATGIESVTGTPFADSLTGDAGVNVLDGRGGDDLLTGGAGGDGIDGGDGADTTTCDDGAHGAGVTLTIGGAGCDSGETLSAVENAIGSSGPDTLTGDGLANRLDGRGGTDTIEGGAGDDTVIGGDGADTMTNTAGTDTLSYDDGRSVGVTVNLAAAPAVGGDAGDSATGFENLTGSPLDDLLTGTDGVNLIDGLGGPDQIDPGAGADAAFGGLGADTIHARDGVADSIDCGQQSDTLQADAADAAIDCETLDLPATLTPTPGATEAPGVTAAPTPTSTATADPAPAREPSLKSVFTVKRRSTKVKTLTLVDLPAGVSVTLACKPPKHAQRSCAFAKRTYPDVSAGTLSLKAPFKRRRLKPGTVITITFDTQTIKLKVRRNKPPKRS
ncbi:MAG: hypothetical protein QOI61_2284, partial [Actinomycetota bacterium]